MVFGDVTGWMRHRHATVPPVTRGMGQIQERAGYHREQPQPLTAKEKPSGGILWSVADYLGPGSGSQPASKCATTCSG
jgi:hypothetical protein